MDIHEYSRFIQEQKNHWVKHLLIKLACVPTEAAERHRIIVAKRLRTEPETFDFQKDKAVFGEAQVYLDNWTDSNKWDGLVVGAMLELHRPIEDLFNSFIFSDRTNKKIKVQLPGLVKRIEAIGHPFGTPFQFADPRIIFRDVSELLLRVKRGARTYNKKARVKDFIANVPEIDVVTLDKMTLDTLYILGNLTHQDNAQSLIKRLDSGNLSPRYFRYLSDADYRRFVLKVCQEKLEEVGKSITYLQETFPSGAVKSVLMAAMLDINEISPGNCTALLGTQISVFNTRYKWWTRFSCVKQILDFHRQISKPRIPEEI